MWVAIAMYQAGDPPPACRVCGERVKVAAKTIDDPVHFQCRYADQRVSYNTAINKIANLQTQWTGLKSKGDYVDLVCPVHGTYKQVLSSALNGHGCQKCYSESRNGKAKYTKSNWIDSFVDTHGNIYDYSSIPNDIQVNQKIPIICAKHGEFLQAANVHKSGHGCPDCGNDKSSIAQRFTQHEFIQRSKAKFGDKYSYHNTVYKGMVAGSPKVTITCAEHGDFDQNPQVHLMSSIGCPKCAFEAGSNCVARSQAEIDIEQFIKSLGATTIASDRSFGFELDIYIPDNKIAFEYNGAFWHSESNGKDRQYHNNKTKVCADNGIQLIHIWDYDWNTKQELIKSRIKAKLGVNRRLYARKTDIKVVNSVTAMEFLSSNHIQSKTGSSVNYGLYYNDELVALMTFGKSRYKKDIKWELIRYCSKQGINVVGGASKLLNYFTKHNTGDIISYSDRMWNNGRLYEAIGFEYVRTTDPSYFYTSNYTLFENRVKYQKHKLHKLLEIFDPDKTEWENMQANGYDRIWDCGTDVWIYKN